VILSGTAIVIAHRLSTVLKADKIVVLESGRIVGQGNHKQLMADNKLYRHLYDLQFDGDVSYGLVTDSV
jgi:subfamily B ATP-binding cassette protein MsbA